MRNFNYRLLVVTDNSRYQESSEDFKTLLWKARYFMNLPLYPLFKYRDFVIIRLSDKVILAQSKNFNGEL